MSDKQINDILGFMNARKDYSNNITYWKLLDNKEAEYCDFPQAMSPKLIDILKQRGIDRLYSHQASAIENVLKHENTVVVTPTASGKTLCYNLPVVNSLIENENNRALYLFPTKALSQDQFGELYDITSALNLNFKVYTFDGDTPAAARKAIRSAGHIVITNPDMLHSGILPHHTLWIKLFENLKYIVIDEIHHYRGVFGSHFANVLRRLKRICEFYGANPTFICCSATIANPVELTETLIGEKVALVDNNGAPHGRKHFIFYNPPVINQELGIRKSVVKEANHLATRFITKGVQTIIFARSRLRVEILASYLKRVMKRFRMDPNLVRAYRGGFLPHERREIEQGVKSGRILGVVSTNALELGIDIGQLNVSILAGYPGSISSTWQQGGRAGRKHDEAVIILIASSSPIDQFIINHPDYFFGASPEVGIINPDNIAILVSHIKAAAFELPFLDNEKFGDVDIEPILEHLDKENILRHTGGRWFWSSQVYPAEEISLRSPTIENFVIVNTTNNTNTIIGEINYDDAPYFIHEDAIYLHQSETYFVDKLDWNRRTAYVRQMKVDYYTDAQAKTDIKVLTVDWHLDYERDVDLEPEESKNYAEEQYLQPIEKCDPRLDRGHPRLDRGDQPFLESKNFGTISVTTIVAKYKKIKFETHENVGWGDIHIPEQEMQTESLWFTFASDLKERLEFLGGDLGSGLNALANLLANVIPVYAMCDPKDIRTIPMVRSPFDDKPVIYIYDKYPGGIGISKKLFDLEKKVFVSAKEMLDGCRCSEGCPSCVGPSIEMGERAKSSAKLILENVLKY